jgi:hypothetical protein
MAIRLRTRAEQETVIRFDREEWIAHLYTADPFMKARWVRKGYPVQPDRQTASGWSADVPVAALTFRRLDHVVERPRKARASSRLRSPSKNSAGTDGDGSGEKFAPTPTSR